MSGKKEQSEVRETLLKYRDDLQGLREILYANVVMAAEIPAPTGAEGLLTRFLSDRFTESGLNDIAFDQAGNIAAVLPGKSPRRNLLLAAHVDKVWPESEDHTVSVGVGKMMARGIADNGLGVAALATLPIVLEHLQFKLDANLILLGTTKSFGRGNLGGMRFFLENTDREFEGALCLEGMNLGRLSFASLGMTRGEIEVNANQSNPGVIATIQKILGALVELEKSSLPAVDLLIGSVDAGSGYNLAPSSGRICFEVRSEKAARVKAVEEKILSLVEEFAGECEGIEARVEIIARRTPGNMGESHPLVQYARASMESLGIEVREEPSISELAALLTHEIPALTLGLTRGQHRHSPKETIELEPLFDGLAHLIGVLQHMDENGPTSF
ncbi:MAG: M20/M25/M40 family metallo-hydrolase [Verrucomicrobiota bacterium]